MRMKLAHSLALLAVTLAWTSRSSVIDCVCAGQNAPPRVGKNHGGQPGTDKPVAAEQLVARLGSGQFQKREAAEKALAALGAKAIPAVHAGLKNADPEVVERCRRLLTVIRSVELARFRTAFAVDTKRTTKFDHPIWNRFVRMAGDSRPSRVLFAAILHHDDWCKISTPLRRIRPAPANSIAPPSATSAVATYPT